MRPSLDREAARASLSFVGGEEETERLWEDRENVLARATRTLSLTFFGGYKLLLPAMPASPLAPNASILDDVATMGRAALICQVTQSETALVELFVCEMLLVSMLCGGDALPREGVREDTS